MHTSYQARVKGWGLGASALLVAAMAWRHFQGPDPDASARELADATMSRNWGAIYDMASDKEKGRQAWGRAQYITVMNEIASRSFKDLRLEKTVGETGRPPTIKTFHFSLRGTRLDGTTVRAPIAVPFYRGERDWHPVIYKLPLDLHNLMETPTRKSLEMLVQACRVAKIREFARMDDNMVFSIVVLEKYLRGEVKWNSIYTHARS